MEGYVWLREPPSWDSKLLQPGRWELLWCPQLGDEEVLCPLGLAGHRQSPMLPGEPAEHDGGSV